MTVDPGRQGMEFLWAALLGIGLGFLYDLGRGVRREKPRLTVPVDMLFSLVFLLSLSLTAVYTRGLRLYQCLGVFLGAGAYFVTVSPPILRQWRRFLRGIGRGCGKIRRTVKKSMVFLWAHPSDMAHNQSLLFDSKLLPDFSPDTRTIDIFFCVNCVV